MIIESCKNCDGARRGFFYYLNIYFRYYNSKLLHVVWFKYVPVLSQTWTEKGIISDNINSDRKLIYKNIDQSSFNKLIKQFKFTLNETRYNPNLKHNIT